MIRTDTLHELFDVAALLTDAAGARAATGSRSSPTPAARGSCAPTPVRPVGVDVPELPDEVRVDARRSCCPPPRRSRNPSTCSRLGVRRGLRADAPGADRGRCVRCDPGDLRPAAGHRGRRRRGRASARSRQTRPRRPDRGGVHDRARARRRSWRPEPCRCRATSFRRTAARAVALAARATGRWRAAPERDRDASRPAARPSRRPRSSAAQLARGVGWLAPAVVEPARAATGCR